MISMERHRVGLLTVLVIEQTSESALEDAIR